MSKKVQLAIKTMYSILLVLLLTSCFDEEPTPAAQYNADNDGVKIMPLGASRVEGARPVFESYRYELWKLLTDEEVAFDFIGTRDDEATYPALGQRRFDYDHEGWSGWTSGDLLQEIESWLDQAGAPDIVLFSSPGGNDALQALPYEEAVININQIIDLIQEANPSVVIIIEQPAPAVEEMMVGSLLAYFEDMARDVEIIAAAQSTATSRVIVADMQTGFDDSMLADEVHYNEAGARFVANRYFELVMELL